MRATHQGAMAQPTPTRHSAEWLRRSCSEEDLDARAREVREPNMQVSISITYRAHARPRRRWIIRLV